MRRILTFCVLSAAGLAVHCAAADVPRCAMTETRGRWLLSGQWERGAARQDDREGSISAARSRDPRMMRADADAGVLVYGARPGGQSELSADEDIERRGGSFGAGSGTASREVHRPPCGSATTHGPAPGLSVPEGTARARRKAAKNGGFIISGADMPKRFRKKIF